MEVVGVIVVAGAVVFFVVFVVFDVVSVSVVTVFASDYDFRLCLSNTSSGHFAYDIIIMFNSKKAKTIETIFYTFIIECIRTHSNDTSLDFKTKKRNS